MKEVASKELDDGFKVKEPVAVIIDGNSASASEILLQHCMNLRMSH